MIYIKDDCLEEKEIQQLNTLLTHPHHREWGEGLVRELSSEHNIVQKIASLIDDTKFSNVEYCNITTYSKDSAMHFHKDATREETTGTSVTFINDDFQGGQGVVEGVTIDPLVGRTYYFDGQKLRHGVLNVIKGVRKVILIWYTNGKNNNN